MDSPYESPVWVIAVYAIVSLAPLVLWRIKARSWGLRSDLDLSVDTLARAWERLGDGTSLPQLAQALFGEHAHAPLLLPLGLALGAALLFRARPGAGAAVSFLTALFYVGAVFGAYLGTPNELVWHLQTSIQRTPLPSLLTGAVAIFFLLEGIERDGRPPAGESIHPSANSSPRSS